MDADKVESVDKLLADRVRRMMAVQELPVVDDGTAGRASFGVGVAVFPALHVDARKKFLDGGFDGIRAAERADEPFLSVRVFLLFCVLLHGSEDARAFRPLRLVAPVLVAREHFIRVNPCARVRLEVVIDVRWR